MSLFKVPQISPSFNGSLRRNFFNGIKREIMKIAWGLLFNWVVAFIYLQIISMGLGLVRPYMVRLHRDKFRVTITCSFRRPVSWGLEAQLLDLLMGILKSTLLSNSKRIGGWDLNGDGVFRVKDDLQDRLLTFEFSGRNILFEFLILPDCDGENQFVRQLVMTWIFTLLIRIQIGKISATPPPLDFSNTTARQLHHRSTAPLPPVPPPH
ncbi:hypothetical protein Tco_1073064 [Tanacetum coccineum]